MPAMRRIHSAAVTVLTRGMSKALLPDQALQLVDEEHKKAPDNFKIK